MARSKSRFATTKVQARAAKANVEFAKKDRARLKGVVRAGQKELEELKVLNKKAAWSTVNEAKTGADNALCNARKRLEEAKKLNAILRDEKKYSHGGFTNFSRRCQK